jgi:hypothetical protein
MCSEKDAYGGAMSRRGGVAAEGDCASVLVHDAATDPKAESSSALSFGSKEGLKEVWFYLGEDAWTVVCDGDGCSGLHLVARGIDTCGLSCDAYLDLAAGLCSLGRIRDEIGEDLTELSRKAGYGG